MYSKTMAPNNEYNNLLTKSHMIEKCIQGMANGDRNALEALYETTKTSVYGFILSILRNKHDAEDIFQEVYVKIYESSNLYQANGKPLAWILTIAKNLCYMKLRKQKDTVDISELHEVLVNEKNDNNIENRILLNATFEIITDEERNIIMLHAVGGIKHREIAKILNLPLSTVLSKYNRAIKKLQKAIKEEDIK